MALLREEYEYYGCDMAIPYANKYCLIHGIILETVQHI